MRTFALVVTLAVALGGTASAADVHGAPIPRRARKLEDGRYSSPMGFRDTVEWYKKELRRRHVNVDIAPAEKVRDVVYLRILPRDTGLGWEAIHVVLAEGKTTIYIVASQSAGDGD